MKNKTKPKVPEEICPVELAASLAALQIRFGVEATCGGELPGKRDRKKKGEEEEKGFAFLSHRDSPIQSRDHLLLELGQHPMRHDIVSGCKTVLSVADGRPKINSVKSSMVEALWAGLKPLECGDKSKVPSPICLTPYCCSFEHTRMMGVTETNARRRCRENKNCSCTGEKCILSCKLCHNRFNPAFKSTLLLFFIAFVASTSAFSAPDASTSASSAPVASTSSSSAPVASISASKASVASTSASKFPFYPFFFSLYFLSA